MRITMPGSAVKGANDCAIEPGLVKIISLFRGMAYNKRNGYYRMYPHMENTDELMRMYFAR